MEEQIEVTIKNFKYYFPKDVTLEEISKDKEVIKNYSAPILTGFLNNEMHHLSKKIDQSTTVEFATYNDRIGNRIYQKGLVFLLTYAFKELYGYDYKLRVCYSMDNYIKISSTLPLKEEIVTNIKNKMKEVVEQKLPIKKCLVTKKDAVKYFENIKDIEKVKSLAYIKNRNITIYKLGDMYNYFYTTLPANTEVFTLFDLEFINENVFILKFPLPDKGTLTKYDPKPKIEETLLKDYKVNERLNIHTAADVNKAIYEGRINDIIKLNEVISNHTLLNLAKEIDDRKDKIKLVLLAGPSASGKTTTSKKLAMFLKTFGWNPKTLSTDDYFIPREKTPKLPNGDYDYENINSLDLKLFNEHLTRLLNKEEIKIPTFNFYKGCAEYLGNTLKLDDRDILIIEGLHCLNEKLTESIPKENKYKIYVSPFTNLNIDNQNNLSLTDIRLIRRMVRDNRTRGYSAEHTINTWMTVREGEDKYIAPYQNEADFVFNTACIYEPSVMKPYAEALLYNINQETPCYEEARRIISLLDMFLAAPSEAVVNDSIIREFLGNSYFE